MAETLFFICMFWSIFHNNCSTVTTSECLYYPCSNTVTFTITIILSHVGISLTVVYISRVLHISSLYLIAIGTVLSIFFITIQIKEFHNYSLTINDS
jgi:heme/copper-type cytochrome/quinol oxidase subunit 3